jgi:uncharacterized protein YndB with AHSA1/START domain
MMTSTSSSRFGSVNVDGDFATLEFERRLSHPPEIVWQAITEPKELEEWYLTKVQIDGRQGGRIEFWSGPTRVHVTGSILVWDPPHVFEHEWNVEPSNGFPKGEKATIRWEIQPDGNASILKMTHRNLTPGTARVFSSGAHAFLDRLEASLDETSMPDWMERVKELRPSYQQKSTPQ